MRSKPGRGIVSLFALALSAGAAIASQSATQAFDTRMQRGLQLLESGQAQRAVVELEAAVAERPESVEARYHLGRALLTGGRPREAVPHLQIALESATEPGPVQFLLAQVFLQLDDLEAAGSALSAAAATRPGYAPIDYYRAELCYRLGRLDAARTGFAQVADLTPGWEMPRVRSGMIALQQDEPTAAIEWFRAALALNERNPALWMRLASALVADGQAEEALAAYRKAVEVGPRFMPAHVALVGQLNGQRDHEGMKEALDGVFALQPNHPLGHYQLASLLSVQGENEPALEAVDVAVAGFDAQAAASGPQPGGSGMSDSERHTYRALSRGLRAQLLMKLGRNDEAEAEARRVVESDPWYPDAHFVLGTLQLRRRDPEGRARLERFKQLSDAREHREQADTMLRADDLVRARSEYELAIAADPTNSTALVGMATVLRRSGDAAGALELLDRAEPSSAETVTWYRERILALDAEGRDDEAQETWRQSRTMGLDLGPEVWRVTRREIGGCSSAP